MKLAPLKQNLIGIIIMPIVTIGVLSQPELIYQNNNAVVLMLIGYFMAAINCAFLAKCIKDYKNYNAKK